MILVTNFSPFHGEKWWASCLIVAEGCVEWCVGPETAILWPGKRHCRNGGIYL